MDNLEEIRRGSLATIYDDYVLYYNMRGKVCSIHYKGILRRSSGIPAINLLKLPSFLLPASDIRVSIYPTNPTIYVNLYIKTNGDVLLDSGASFDEISTEFGVTYLIG